MTTTDPQPDPLRSLFARQLAPYMAAVEGVVREAARVEVYKAGHGRAPAVGALGAATSQLADVMASTKATADMLGREATVRAADRIARTQGRLLARALPAGGGGMGLPPPGALPAAGGAPIPGPGGLPRVPFTEAVADIVAREPRLAAGAAEVAHAYGSEHVFAMARASEIEVVKRVQAALAKAVATGQSIPEVVEIVADLGDFTRAYAETVVRTNLTTSFSAGRFRQMADPAVAFAIGALRFTAIGDADTRANHAAADGLIAAPGDPVWHRLAPPLGFRCRCTLSFVSWPELGRRGLLTDARTVRVAHVPSGAHADAGFSHSGRPDIVIYGV